MGPATPDLHGADPSSTHKYHGHQLLAACDNKSHTLVKTGHCNNNVWRTTEVTVQINVEIDVEIVIYIDVEIALD